MARLNARWLNFWERGQTWYHFWQDASLVTVSSSFTLDAIIGQPDTGSFTLNATIKRAQTGSFTVDADLRASEPGSFTIDAVLRRTQTGSLTIDAVTRRSSTSGAALDSVLRRSQSSSGSIDAIKRRSQSSSFSIDAFVRPHFTIDAWLGSVPGFTIDALIAVQVFFDDFNRVVSGGLGGIWVPTFGAGSSSTDGSEAVIAAGGFSIFTGIPDLRAGTITYDFLVTDPTDSNSGLDLWQQTYVTQLIRGFPSSTAVSYVFDAASSSAGIAIVAGWYTTKILVGANTGDPIASKIWLRGDPEPDWQWTDTLADTSGGLTPNQMYATGETSAPFEFTNIRFLSFLPSLLLVATSFTIDAEIRAENDFDFSIDAVIQLRQLFVDAIVRERQIGAFLINAMIQRHGFTLNAVIVGRIFFIDASIATNLVGVTKVNYFRIDARLLRIQKGNVTLDAWIFGLVVDLFTIDAQISAPATPTSSFTLNAVVSSIFRQRSFSVSSLIKATRLDAFGIDALVGDRDSPVFGSFSLHAEIEQAKYPFTIDAVLAHSVLFRIDAYLVGAFTIRANIMPSFSLNAIISPLHGARFSIDARVRRTEPGSFGIDAVIRKNYAFAIDAVIGRGKHFTLDAWVQPYFTINAYIKGSPAVVPPGGGGSGGRSQPPPPGGPPAGPGGPGGAGGQVEPQRSFRIQITVDGVDMTEFVIFGMTSFTQQAKTGPGTFQITMRGVQSVRSGAVVYLAVDDFLQFGGFATAIGHSYAGPDLNKPLTVLSGPDFNILFDRVIVWNAAPHRPYTKSSENQGPYIPIPSWPIGTLDGDLIKLFCANYLDLPAGFDSTSAVENTGTANPDSAGTIDNGVSFRQFMQGQSTRTQAVWWISPYMSLNNHSRETVTAPAVIGDGFVGAVSCRNLVITEAIDKMVNDSLVWGTLAKTISGQVVFTRSTLPPTHGLWQQFEYHSDIHTLAHTAERADTITERWGQPIISAQLEIWEPGFQAGMVATLNSETFGVTANLVIRQMDITFPIVEPPSGGIYYGNPLYALDLGLDPEEPWGIYDWIPFEPFDIPHISFWWGHGWITWIDRFNNRDVDNGFGWDGPADGPPDNRFWNEEL